MLHKHNTYSSKRILVLILLFILVVIISGINLKDRYVEYAIKGGDCIEAHGKLYLVKDHTLGTYDLNTKAFEFAELTREMSPGGLILWNNDVIFSQNYDVSIYNSLDNTVSLISNRAYDYCLYANKLYYVTSSIELGHLIVEYDLDNNSTRNILLPNTTEVKEFTVINDWIYYFDTKTDLYGEIKKINLDGQNNNLIIEASITTPNLWAADGKLYYVGFDITEDPDSPQFYYAYDLLSGISEKLFEEDQGRFSYHYYNDWFYFIKNKQVLRNQYLNADAELFFSSSDGFGPQINFGVNYVVVYTHENIAIINIHDLNQIILDRGL